METTLNQEAIFVMLVERLKTLTESIKRAKSEAELQEIAENIAAAGRATRDSLNRAFLEDSISGCEASKCLSRLNEVLEGALLLILLKAVDLEMEEEEDNE